jgi:CubicO group peptidase (beta-lactamase class C family)
MPRRLALAAILATPLSSAPAQQPAPPTSEQLRELLTPARQKHDVPALGAAVVTSKGPVAVAVVGVRKRGAKAEATTADRFHIGSDTKAMTAAMVATLVEEGKLRWETTVAEGFPDLAKSMPEATRGVTLAQLLAHTSGLPAGDAAFWKRVPRAGSLRAQRLAAVKIALAGKPKYQPGAKFVYANLGYVIAGAMAERVADAPWEELMHKRLLGPLGMKSAGFGPAGDAKALDQPWAHDAAGTPIPPGPDADNPPVMGPAGTEHCSLGDWSKFIADQLKGARGEKALLKPETYKKLHAPMFAAQDSYTVGGWGHIEMEKAGGLVLHHDGSNTMNYAVAWLVPGRDFAVLVVCNQAGAGERACHQVRDEILKQFLPPGPDGAK